jgi:hypothetical protein
MLHRRFADQEGDMTHWLIALILVLLASASEAACPIGSYLWVDN